MPEVTLFFPLFFFFALRHSPVMMCPSLPCSSGLVYLFVALCVSLKGETKYYLIPFFHRKSGHHKPSLHSLQKQSSLMSQQLHLHLNVLAE